MTEIDSILEVIETNPYAMRLEGTGLLMVHQLLKIASDNIDSEDCVKAMEIVEKIRNANHNSPEIAYKFASRITAIGGEAYSLKKYVAAEIAFKILAEIGDVSAQNNYAYMIRRGEIARPSRGDHILALKMLREGVKRDEPFSFVNTALVFALMVGDDESWHIADWIFERLSISNVASILSWWGRLAEEGDKEGYLVVFFLLRHGKIEKEGESTPKDIAMYLKSIIKGFPDWLVNS